MVFFWICFDSEVFYLGLCVELQKYLVPESIFWCI